ncbi:hypothetical protein D3C72_2142940 [compost metagenome]
MESLAGDPLHFLDAVCAGIHRFLAVGAFAAEFVSKVDAAGQLAHHNQVGSFQNLRLQGGSFLQAVKNNGGTDVGIEAQCLADAE